ncbi:MAG: lamin tail domain-containing protein [Candidatus Kapaibacteriota bacterium]
MMLVAAVIALSSPCEIENVRGLDRNVVVVVSNAGEDACIDLQLSVACGSHHVERTIPVIRPEQDVELSIPITDLGWPTIHGWADVHCTLADRTTTAILEFPPAPGMVVINEVMFDPRPGLADYVEIITQDYEPRTLQGWILRDANTSAMIPDSTTLAPGSYTVLASKASVAEMMVDHTAVAPVVLSRAINFNTTGDRVALCTSSGLVVDELTYSPTWHSSVLERTRGIALEKLHPAVQSHRSSSWTSCTDSTGGTPGRANSTTRPVPDRGTLQVFPSPFSSDPRDVQHPAVISYQQPFRTARATMSIVSPSGVRVATLLNSEGIFWQGALAWDGTSDVGQRVEPGPYVVVLECVDAESSATHHATALIVVGR